LVGKGGCMGETVNEWAYRILVVKYVILGKTEK
jgi:hypothetical protein